MAAMRYAQTASLKEAQGRYGASGMPKRPRGSSFSMSVVLSFFFWIPPRHQAPDGEAPQGEQGQVPVREGCQRQKYQDAQQA